MMQTDYVESHFCTRCMRETEHVLFTYLNQGSLTCQFCQHTEVFNEDAMKRTYTVVSIDEKDRRTARRRMVVVELECRSEPNALGERKGKVETITVQYPAYGEDHYLASVSLYPNGGVIGHIEAKEIANEIRKFVED